VKWDLFPKNLEQYTKGEWFDLACELYRVVGDAVEQGDKAVFAKLESWADEMHHQGNRYGFLLKRILGEIEGHITFPGLVFWAHAGFPQIEMGHKFAASLLVSTPEKSLVELVQPPWPAFIIEVPDKLLSIYDNRSGGYLPLRRLLVTQISNPNGSWAYVGVTDSPLTFWQFALRPIDMTDHSDRTYPDIGDPEFKSIDYDERCQKLIGKLIINSCLALSVPDLVEKRGSGHAAYEKTQRRGQKAPNVLRSFKLGKPIELDFRDRVERYLTGQLRKGQKLDVQILVRGHFKRQHYGAGNSQVKVIWREPFYRGPEDAPQLVRAHVLPKE
jgi:hypothetical protein